MEDNKEKRPLSKKTKITVIALISVLLLFCSFALGYFSRNIFGDSEVLKTQEIVDLIYGRGLSYDKDTLKKREMTTDETADILLDEYLDEYSRYYTEEEYKELKESEKGNYSGIGLSFSGNDLKIIKVVFNSPADIAGLIKGDVLKAFIKDGKTFPMSDTAQVRDFMAEVNDGDNFDILYERDGVEYCSTISKRKYRASYVSYQDKTTTMKFRDENGKKVFTEIFDKDGKSIGADALDGETAIITYTSFAQGSFEELKAAFEYLKAHGKKKLVFDLRDNGGGFMDVLCRVSSFFLAQEKIIAYAEDKDGVLTHFATTENCLQNYLQKISIVANENTASASECFINALLYYGKGETYAFTKDRLIIENEGYATGLAHTYGKGVMQETYELKSGGALKITSAFIYAPDKKTCVSKKNARNTRGIETTAANSTADSALALELAIERIS